MIRRPLHRGELMRHGLSGITDFPSVQSAIDYVKSKVGAFFQLPYEYTKAKKRIAVALAAAKAKNDNTTIAKLNAIDMGVNNLQKGYPSTESKVKTFLDQLKAAGFGIIPLVIAGAAIVVGGAVAYQLVTWGKLNTQLNAIEKGIVPSTFFDRQSFFGIEVPGIAIVGGIAGLAFLAYRFTKKG
jgi:hypothetical protein